jgi:preprotein translocase subunit SecD
MRIVVFLIAVILLPGCDYLQQYFGEKSRVTLEIDRDWVVQSHLESLKNRLQGYLRDNKLHYLSIKQLDDTMIIKYQHDPSVDWVAKLSQQFPEYAFASNDVMLEPRYREMVVSLPGDSRLQMFSRARDYDANAVVRMLKSQGITAETKAIGHIQFDVLIPESKYSGQLIASLTKSSRLGFYLVANQKTDQTFPVTDEAGKHYELQQPGIIKGDAIISASASNDRYSGMPALIVVLDANAAQIMKKTTQENIGRKMAVILMEQGYGEAAAESFKQARVVSVATIQGVFSKRFMITGLTSEEAKQLETYLLAGGLVTPLRVIE